MRYALAILAATAAYGQLTTLTGTIRASDGSLANGSATFELSGSCTAPDGTVLNARRANTITITSGVFSASLYANNTCSPSSTFYRSTWDLRTATGTVSQRLSQNCIINYSATAISVSSACSDTTTAPVPVGVIYTASATIDPAAVVDGACVLDTTAVSVTGASLGGRTTVGVTVQPPEGVQVFAKVTGPNSVKLEICNFSGATYNPPSAIYYFGVHKQ